MALNVTTIRKAAITAVVVKKEMYDTFMAAGGPEYALELAHGYTYSAHPVACAAALGAIESIEQDHLMERAIHIGQILNESLTALAARYPVIGEVRGRGAMQAIELVYPGTKEPNAEAVNAVVKYCQSQGVLILTAGTYNNVIRFLPPLVITDALLLDALQVLEQGFASLASL